MTDFRVDLDTNRAERAGRSVRLSPNEAAAVYKLAKHAPKCVPVEDIKVAMWGRNDPHHNNTVYVTFCTARARLAELGMGIEMVRKRGYRIFEKEDIMIADPLDQIVDSYKHGWIQTYSGLSFSPAAPDPEKINLQDISRALSKQCRFAGHCIEFYSVA